MISSAYADNLRSEWERLIWGRTREPVAASMAVDGGKKKKPKTFVESLKKRNVFGASF